VEDRSSGYPRITLLGAEFVLSGEYRALSASYAEISEVVRSIRRGAVEVRVITADKGGEKVADGAVEEEEQPETVAEATGAGTAASTADAPAPPPARKEHEPVFVATLDDMVEHFIALGRKGIAVNRYKGLGEMNPDTLWATTMNPETRTLLQVRAEDRTEADQMFTTLMGDQVEPRRKFIEDNALDVRNLDI
jgi:DNA gyrase subunit B